MSESINHLWETEEIEEKNMGITTREALFGVIGDEPVEITPERIEQIEHAHRSLQKVLYGPHDYSDVPF